MDFEPSGTYLLSGGVDHSPQIIDTETFKTLVKITDAHDSPLYKVKAINENLAVTGDEDGTIKLWDKRHSKMSKSVMEDRSMEDAVTDFLHTSKDPNYLIASSAEGTFVKSVACSLSSSYVYF